MTHNPQTTNCCYISALLHLWRVKQDTSNLVHLLIVASCSQPMTCCPQMRRGQGHVTPANFGKTVAISWKYYEIATWLQWATNRKSYASYQMATLPMTLGDPWLSKWSTLVHFGPLLYLWHGDATHSSLAHLLIMASSSQQQTWRRSHDPFNFWYTTSNSWKRCNIAMHSQCKTNRN